MPLIKFRKNINLFSLTMTGLTTMIGSGWLLGTQKIAEIAGPASILAWLLGASVALLVALFYIEIGSRYPSAGGIGYYSHITHGRFCGFLTSWINWLSIVAVPPIEAQAMVQYLSQISPHMMQLYDVNAHVLTTPGMVSALGFMLIFMLINYGSVQFFIRFNNFFTCLKIIVPIMTIAALAYNGLHVQNFGHDMATFMPFGFKSVLISIATSGVVMSFNGFQSPLTFSEEIASPKKMLPIAVIASIVIALFIYLLLQIVFIGSLSPAQIAAGFTHINFRSPYVDLLLAANLQLMVTTVYMGSVISPGVSGTAFLASSARILYSLAHEGHLPRWLCQLDKRYHNPRYAMMICALAGTLFLLLFKGWYDLVAVISILHLSSYLAAPIITIANRRKFGISAMHHQFVLRGAYLLAPVLLFILMVLIYFAPWQPIHEMLIVLMPGFLFYFYFERKLYPAENFLKVLKGATWLIILYGGLVMATVTHHGVPFFSMAQSLFILALSALIAYVLGAFFVYEKVPNAPVKY